MGNVKSHRREISLALGLPLILVGLFQNCSKIGFTEASSSLGAQSVVCNPLDNSGASSSAQLGMIGKLLYVPLANQNAANISSYSDLLVQGVTSDTSIYLSQFNVQTRAWTQGFSTDGTNALVDDQGNKLLEYFALQMKSVLKLSASDSPGYYQFAVISDDGGYITSTADSVTSVLAGSTGGWHSTKAECGASAFYMDSTTAMPLDLVYYQGPRDEIGMVFMWRKVADPSQLDQTECGAVDGGFFVEPSAGTPSRFEQMQAAGWNVVPAANFNLPESAGANPCAASSNASVN